MPRNMFEINTESKGGSRISHGGRLGGSNFFLMLAGLADNVFFLVGGWEARKIPTNAC